MLLNAEGLEQYVLDLAEQAEEYGVTLSLEPDEGVPIEIEPDGTRRFTLIGFLPDGRRPPQSRLEVSERWLANGNESFERSGYRYELVDHERDFRRAFHRHDEAVFERAYGVVVHEHCESPVGHAPCDHVFGAPVRDGYRAVSLLVDLWVADPPDCTGLLCLESI